MRPHGMGIPGATRLLSARKSLTGRIPWRLPGAHGLETAVALASAHARGAGISANTSWYSGDAPPPRRCAAIISGGKP